VDRNKLSDHAEGFATVATARARFFSDDFDLRLSYITDLRLDAKWLPTAMRKID
jgi:hypothetical protein